MAWTNIDKVNGRIIRKLHSTDKSKAFGFISGDPCTDGKTLANVKEHINLTEARTYCGFEHKTKVLTAPKSSYPQNVKGYDPHSARK